MMFTNPIWLWGLSGLAIPVAIHLLSRKEGKVIYIGSLRHLQESDSARFSSIRLNEILLLLLRCAIIALVVLLLAGLSIDRNSNKNEKWLVIENGLQNDANVKLLIDSLKSQQYEVHYLRDNFPVTADSSNKKIDYWSLAEDLRTKDLNDAVVISYNWMRNFNGIRVSLPENIHWITREPEEKEFVAVAAPWKEDSVWFRMATSSAGRTAMETYTLRAGNPKFPVADSAARVEPRSIQVTIVSDPAFDHDRKILTASLKALQTITPQTIHIDLKSPTEVTSTSGWTFWLSEKTPATSSKQLIGYSSCTLHALPLLERTARIPAGCSTSKNFSWVITKRLNEGVVFREHFIQLLAGVLLPTLPEIPDDRRALPEKITWSAKEEHSATTPQREVRALDNFLLAAILLLLITERVISFQRKQ